MDGFRPAQGDPAGWRQGMDEALDRRARIREVAERMRDCLEALDDLGMWKGGAHLDQALAEVERHF